MKPYLIIIYYNDRMAGLAKAVIDYLYSESPLIKVNWNKCNENGFSLIGYDDQFEYYHTVFLFGLCVIVSSSFTKIDSNDNDDNDRAVLTSINFILESEEHKIEFQKTFKQICVDIHNSELKSQGLLDFI